MLAFKVASVVVFTFSVISWRTLRTDFTVMKRAIFETGIKVVEYIESSSPSRCPIPRSA